MAQENEAYRAEWNAKHPGEGDLPVGYHGEGGGGGTTAGGTSGSIEAILAKQKQESADILASQKAEEEGLFKQFETLRAGQETLPTLYSRLTEKAGIPALQEQLTGARTEVAKVRDLLDRLEEDISSRTQGYLVSEAQRRRSLSAEEAPLRTQLGRLLTGQEVAAGQVASAQAARGEEFQVATSQQERELESTKLRISAFSDRAAREMTSYTQTQQNELTSLLKKMETETALTTAELNRAATLAQNERTFEQEKEKIRLQMEADVEKAIRTKGTGTSTITNPLATYSLIG